MNSGRDGITALSRRNLLQLAGGAGFVAMTPRLARAQAGNIDVLVPNAILNAPLRGILEKAIGAKVADAPFQSTTDSVSRLMSPGGTSRYDMMISQTEFSKTPILGSGEGKEKVLPLDLAKIPNLAKLSETFRPDVIARNDKTYMIPIFWGFDAVVYNKDVIPETDELTKTWGMIFEDKYAGKIAWFDTAHQMLMAAGLYLGKKKPETMTTAELKEVGDFLISKKKNVRTIYTSFAQCTSLLASGEVACAYSPIPVRVDLEKSGKNVATAWCKEGVLSFSTGAYIPKDAKKPAIALAAIDAMLAEDYASKLTAASGYLSCSTAGTAALSKEEALRLGYGILEGATAHYPLRFPPNISQWVEVWARVKSA